MTGRNRSGQTSANAVALETLLAPVGLDRFMSEYWEEKPLLLPSAGQAALARLLGPDDLDGILSGRPLQPHQIRLAKAGGVIPPERYCTETRGIREVSSKRVVQEHLDGATIILERMDTWWRPLSCLASGVERALGLKAQTNVYITPEGAQGFGAHYDTHDVLILQLSGAKNWRIYDRDFELPLISQPHRTDPAALASPTIDTVFAAGDVAYIPRGWTHEAVTDSQASVHVTLGLFPVLWQEVLHRVVDRIAETDAGLRSAVPAGTDGTSPDYEGLAERVSQLLDPRLLASAAQELVAKKQSRDDPPGPVFSSVQRARDVDEATYVRRADGLRSSVSTDGDNAVLAWGPRSISLPRDFEDELKFVNSLDVFRPCDIPTDLDAAGKLTLVRRLVKERFLVLHDQDRTVG